MSANKTDIINRLQRDILSLQGYKTMSLTNTMDVGLGPVAAAFPNSSFPLGAVHEFLISTPAEAAASGGFITGLLSSIMQNNGIALWISTCRIIFPPGMRFFGIRPEQVIFVDLQKEIDVLWVMEEGLKFGGLAAVVAEMPGLSFTTSRRLQLAVEQSRVTGFVIRPNLQKMNPTACESRWKISSITSEAKDNLPGVGYPRWKVELLKVRNGKPGKWQIEWTGKQFQPILPEIASLPLNHIRKTG